VDEGARGEDAARYQASKTSTNVSSASMDAGGAAGLGISFDTRLQHHSPDQRDGPGKSRRRLFTQRARNGANVAVPRIAVPYSLSSCSSTPLQGLLHGACGRRRKPRRGSGSRKTSGSRAVWRSRIDGRGQRRRQDPPEGHMELPHKVLIDPLSLELLPRTLGLLLREQLLCPPFVLPGAHRGRETGGGRAEAHLGAKATRGYTGVAARS
jgi:hypothetical protein